MAPAVDEADVDEADVDEAKAVFDNRGTAPTAFAAKPSADSFAKSRRDVFIKRSAS
jgi:hypothetical protein